MEAQFEKVWIIICYIVLLKGRCGLYYSYILGSWVMARVIVEMLIFLEKICKVENLIKQRQIIIDWYCI